MLKLQDWTLQDWTQTDGVARVDIAGLNISGRVCESELGNMLRFCYGRPVKMQPTGTRVEKSVELTFTERNYLIAYLK